MFYIIIFGDQLSHSFALSTRGISEQRARSQSSLLSHPYGGISTISIFLFLLTVFPIAFLITTRQHIILSAVFLFPPLPILLIT